MVKVVRSYRFAPTTMMFLEHLRMENPDKSETDLVEECIEQAYVVRHSGDNNALLNAYFRVQQKINRPPEEEA